MKKILLLFFTVLSLSLQASPSLAEVRGSFFVPSWHRFRHIYGIPGTANFEVSAPLINDLYFYESAGVTYGKGRSLGLAYKTSIRLYPLSVGLKYFFHCNDYNFYLGAGGLATYVNIHDDSPFVIPHSRKWTYGATLKSGVIHFISDSIFVDLFVDYSFLWVNFLNTNNGTVVRNKANIGGWNIGAGLGIGFDCLSDLFY